MKKSFSASKTRNLKRFSKPKTKAVPYWKEYGFDSEQEYYVSCWLNELEEVGLVSDITYQPSQITLNEEISFITKEGRKKPVKQILLKKHIYTPDFEFIADDRLVGVVMEPHDKLLRGLTNRVVIEVKPDLPNLKLIDTTGSTRLFTSRTQPWVWEKHSKWVNLITPNILFSKTFVPKAVWDDFFYKKGVVKGKQFKVKGDPKVEWKVRTIDEYLEILNNELQ